MSYKNKKKNQNQPERKFPLPLLIPIILLLTVVPLITYMYSYDTRLGNFDWYTSYEETTDFFLYYKMVWAVISSVLMIFCMVYLFFAEEKKPIWIKNLIPLAIYCGITLISAIASKYSYFSFHGIYEQFEPVWMLLGYGIIVYYCFYILRSESALKRTMNWFIAGILVMCALGLSQVFSHDFFRTDAGQRLMTPQTYSGDVNFTFELGRPYLSLYNPNYVGYYVAMIVPVLAALLFSTKKLMYRIGYDFIIAALLWILFASQSRAGIVALGFSFLLMLLCMRKVFLKNWKITIVAIAMVFITFIGVNALNGNVLLNRMKEMFQTAPETHALKYIETNDDNVTINYNDNLLVFRVSQDTNGNDVFALTDGDNKPVEFVLGEDNINYSIPDSRFATFTFCSSRSDTFNGFIVSIDGHNWFFTNLMKSGDNTYYALGGSAKQMKLTQQEDTWSFLEEHYHLANKRGYIWARTLPLLKKYFFLGSGPDTFIIAYPNNDLVGMYNSDHLNEIITKPHCMYLQIAVQTGVLSLLALLIFFGWYLISCIKLYWKNPFNDYMSLLGVGIFAGIAAYLILGLTNDSCVAVSPLFYSLVGMGLGVNYKVKSDLKNDVPAKTSANNTAASTKKTVKKQNKKR